MTVDLQSYYARTAGDGTTTVFAVPFAVLESDQLAVELVHQATGAVSAQTADVDYTLSIAAGGQSASVTFAVAPGAQHWVVRRRSFLGTQPDSVPARGRLPSETLEAALDRTMMDVQAAWLRSERALQMPLAEPAPIALPPAAERAGNLLAFDAAGAPVMQAIDVESAYANAGSYATVASFAAASPPDDLAVANVLGYWAIGDGGGGLYRQVAEEPAHAAKVQTANGLWYELDEVAPNIRMFGARSDGVNLNDDEIAAGQDYVSARGGGLLFVPAVDRDGGEKWAISRPILMMDGVKLEGLDRRNSLIENVREVNEEDGDQACISWAGYSGSGASPLNIESETFRACDDVQRGESTIKLTTVADAVHYPVGGIVFIRNSTRLDDQNFLDTGLPAHFQLLTMNEVDEVDATTGIVKLKYPHDDDGTGMKMALSSGTLRDAYDRPIRIKKDTAVRNLSLKCTWNQNKGSFVWGGAFRFELDRLDLEGADGLTMQLMSRGRITDIEGVIGSKMFDAAIGTSHVFLDKIGRKQRAGDFFLSPHGPTLDITAWTYDDETGEVVLTVDSAINPNQIFEGGSVKVSNLVGTGDGEPAHLEGVSTVTFAEDTTIKFVAIGGLGAMSGDDGIVRQATADELCIIGQGCHDITIGTMILDAGTLDRTVLRIGRARRVYADYIEVIAPGARGANRPVIAGGTDYFGPDGVVIKTLIIRCGDDPDSAPWSGFHINGSDTAAEPAQWNVVHPQVYGALNSAIKINYNAKKWLVVNPIAPGGKIENDSTDPSTVVITGGVTYSSNPPVYQGGDAVLETKAVATVAKTYTVMGASRSGRFDVEAAGQAVTGSSPGYLQIVLGDTVLGQLDLEADSGTQQTINSGTYDPETGALSLDVTAHGLSPGQSVLLAGLTGTGAFAALAGTNVTIAGTTGDVVNCTAELDLGAATITGGVLVADAKPWIIKAVIQGIANNLQSVQFHGRIGTPAGGITTDVMDVRRARESFTPPTEIKLVYYLGSGDVAVAVESWMVGTAGHEAF